MKKQLHLKGKSRIVKKFAAKTLELGYQSVRLMKSNRYLYALIYNEKRQIVKSFSTRYLASNNKEATISLAKTVVNFCKEGNFDRMVFDRGGYKYHGNIREFAEVLRGEEIIR